MHRSCPFLALQIATALPQEQPMAVTESVSVLIVGGGICGVLAGQRCAARGLSFRIFDQGPDFGGTWVSLANAHSQLQVDAQSTAYLRSC